MDVFAEGLFNVSPRCVFYYCYFFVVVVMIELRDFNHWGGGWIGIIEKRQFIFGNMVILIMQSCQKVRVGDSSRVEGHLLLF